MSMLAAFRRRLVKSVPMAIVATLVGAVILTPAISGAATFLTKQKGNKLFLGNTRQVTQTQSIPSNTGQALTALCPPGQQATGGGASSAAMFTGSGSTSRIRPRESAQ
jgi:hypothetical protein